LWAVLVTGCIIPGIDLSAKMCESSADCGQGEICSPDQACVQTIDACLDLPAFSGTQVVDGFDTDFAGVPVFVLNPADAVVWEELEGDRVSLTARVAWSSSGLHAHFHVDYPDGGSMVVPMGTDPLYYGDGIELFLKGDNHLTGVYGGANDPGAIQLIAVPAAMGQPARAQLFTNQGQDDLGPLSPANFASRLVGSSAYELELELPWALMQPDAGLPPPIAGAQIGFDVGVDYHTRSGPSNVQYQLLLALNPITGPDPTCPQGPHPSCDDRTWCTPRLDSP
jgi:hypothetical protein